jgi:hypothetical protein
MTLNTILQIVPAFQTVPLDARGEWFLATDVLEQKSIAELLRQNSSEAHVLGYRKGFWNGNLHQEEAELFLWGTPEQLALAQESMRLQSAVDALLDRPEQYWG